MPETNRRKRKAPSTVLAPPRPDDAVPPASRGPADPPRPIGTPLRLAVLFGIPSAYLAAILALAAARAPEGRLTGLDMIVAPGTAIELKERDKAN